MGSTKRYGTRYGRKVRINAQQIEDKARDTYECPDCSKMGVEKEAAGIWKCQKCGTKFASKAFEFENRSLEMIQSAIEKKEAEMDLSEETSEEEVDE